MDVNALLSLLGQMFSLFVLIPVIGVVGVLTIHFLYWYCGQANKVVNFFTRKLFGVDIWESDDW